MYSDREVLCFLQHIPGIGNKTIQSLWGYFKTGDAIYRAEEKALESLLNERQKKAFLHAREKVDASERIAKLKAEGIDYYSVFDWNYPRRLRKIADAPLALFVKGSLPPENNMTASVVGARKHSYYGEKYAKVFSGMLAEAGVSVISGMAKGIDSIAQMTAIEKRGQSYAVLGCGVDICYPPECRKLYDKLPFYGGIISEYPPGTAPNAGLFPLRNRIISGLGDILLVMEARERSGTLITVDMALEQGKEIWALPGRSDDVLSYGCNRLISQGAGILTGENDFKEELEVLKQKYTQVFKGKVLKKREAACENEKSKEMRKQDEYMSCQEEECRQLQQLVLAVLDYQPLSLNHIHFEVQKMQKETIFLQEVGNTLIELCLQGKAKQMNGGFYIRV